MVLVTATVQLRVMFHVASLEEAPVELANIALNIREEINRDVEWRDEEETIPGEHFHAIVGFEPGIITAFELVRAK